ncbi:monofunctional biosynthetic peptidoglycan transglycosylase [bacterium]|nr:MAG: monofunctional biosynthetic peptidoglycan transglycosylase [bacterium]
MSRRGVFRRVFRGLLILAVVFVGGSLAAVAVLRFVAPPTTAFMVHARIAALGSDPPLAIRHQWRPLAEISPSAALAVVAAEDQLFPVHRGFDVKSIQKAMEDNERGGRTRGASTISQQVAKNLFLWSGRSWVRKGLEAWFTVLIEFTWPKRRILETYLNVAQFGRGIYGVESASRAFFRKDARSLTATEAALLAAVLPNPVRLRADRPSAYVLGRGRDIQAQMRALGPRYLDDALGTEQRSLN